MLLSILAKSPPSDPEQEVQLLDENTPAPMGHNSGGNLPYDPEALQPLELRAREIADAGAAWTEVLCYRTTPIGPACCGPSSKPAPSG